MTKSDFTRKVRRFFKGEDRRVVAKYDETGDPIPESVEIDGYSETDTERIHKMLETER